MLSAFGIKILLKEKINEILFVRYRYGYGGGRASIFCISRKNETGDTKSP